LDGKVGRYPYSHPNDDMEQPRMFWTKVLDEQAKKNTVFNICSSLGQCRKDIQDRMLQMFY
jgi:catalase